LRLELEHIAHRHPSIHPTHVGHYLYSTLTFVTDTRTQLEFWLEEAATIARGLCSEHDFNDALTLAATDRVWAAYSGNVTNLADVIASNDPPQLRARPTWALPGALDPGATSADVLNWRHANTARNHAYNSVTARLAAGLLISIGEANKIHIHTVKI
jgi:hypothetical protein